MRPAHPILLIAVVTVILGISCRYFSGADPNLTPGPQPFTDASSLKFIPDSLPDAQQGTPYQVQIKVENVKTFVGQFAVETGNLPPGLSLERVAGENAARIVGTPAETGTFTFVLNVWCEGTNSPGQTGRKEYAIVVK